MLYRLRDNKLCGMRENDFELESEIQKLVEINLKEILGLEFVASEFSISGNAYRIDTLAFDNESNAFTIIEYKRGRNESLIDQGYTYLNILLDRKADFVLKYNEVTNTSKRLNDIDWAQSRVIFISPKFTDYQIKANDFKNNPIELIKITRYENEIFEIDRIKKNSNIKLEVQNNIQDNMLNRVDKEIKVYTEEDHLNGVQENIKQLYGDLKDGILEWDEIDIEPKKLYIAFKGRNNIMSVVVQNKAIKIMINLKKGELDDVRKVARDMANVGHWATGDYEVAMSSDEDLEYVLSLIKQSWKKNKK